MNHPDPQSTASNPFVVEIPGEFINPREAKKKKDKEDFLRITIENQSLNDVINRLKQSQDNLEISNNRLKDENNLLLEKLLSLQDEISDLISKNSNQFDENHGLTQKIDELVKLSEVRLNETLIVRSEKMKAFEDFAGLKKTQIELIKKYESALNENSLLLRQLYQLQEDIEGLDRENKSGEKLVLESNERWTRLEARHPDLIDYEKISLENVDTTSNHVSFTIRLINCFHVGRVFETVLFKIKLIEGAVAISFLNENGREDDFLIIPELVNKSQDEYGKFVAMPYEMWLCLKIAISALRDLMRLKWANINLNELDPSFWSSFVLSLIGAVEQLPPILRYSNVSLKRELVHADYEHLWLEIHGIEFGVYKKKKLELRLGAALISGSGKFSQHPKIEFPLVNGSLPPFDSWYAESRDDFGPKFELRFSLENAAIDFAALAKLNNVDRNLVCAICIQLPVIIERLASNGIALSRPIKIWKDFSSATANLMINKLKESIALKRDGAKLKAETKVEPSTQVPVMIEKKKTSNKRIRVEKIHKIAHKQAS